MGGSFFEGRKARESLIIYIYYIIIFDNIVYRELATYYTGTCNILHGNLQHITRELATYYTGTWDTLHGNYQQISWKLATYFTA